MTNMRRSIINIILLLVLVPGAMGQDVKVTSSFDSSLIYIGDQIKFTITVEQPSGLSLTLPFFKDTLSKNIDIISGPVFDTTINDNGRIKIIEKYLITSFDSGFYQIPPVYAEMKNETGIKRFYSDYSHLRVARINIAPADTSLKIFDIVEPYRAPVTLGEIIPWGLVIVLAGVLTWAAIRFIRKLKNNKAGVEVVINPDPAHIIAFRQLEKLKSEQLWQKGEIKIYYTRLTEILRQYLENRFSVLSLELTTSETLEALVKTGFKKDGTYNQLKTVLTGADLVKFAKYKPEPAENDLHFKNSWDFVEATRIDEVSQAENTDKKSEESL
jgi:uncharacterized repeat protein (TIGR01451 family)